MPEQIELSREVEDVARRIGAVLDFRAGFEPNVSSGVDDKFKDLARAIIARVREDMNPDREQQR
jgi:hypothetical protein